MESRISDILSPSGFDNIMEPSRIAFTPMRRAE
jgi:hypothetical protein